MLSAVIIEDNELLLRCLGHKVEWSKYGFALAGVADNGAEGLALIERIKPDLVITDIQMPGLDGLKMIEQTQGRGMRMRIVIITGYDRFEYAKQAIKLQVDAFLLKPLDYDELFGVLAQLEASIRDERAQRETIKRVAQLEAERQGPNLTDPGTREIMRKALEQGDDASLSAFGQCLGPEISGHTYIVAYAGAGTVRTDFPRYAKAVPLVRQLCKAVIDCPLAHGHAVMLFLFQWVHIQQVDVLMQALCMQALGIERSFLGYNAKFYQGIENIPRAYQDARDRMTCLRRELLSVWTIKTIGLLDADCNASLQSIADALGVSASHLSALIKRDLGKSFRDLSIAARIIAAKQLLADPRMRVSAIAEKAGYQDYVGFYKAFKKETGISPNAYRAICAQQS